MGLQNINAALKQSTPEPIKINELYTNKEKALNFQLLVDREINALAAAPAAGGAPNPRLEHLRSLAGTLALIAHTPAGRDPGVQLTTEQSIEFMNLMGEYRLSAEAVQANKEKMSDEDVEAIMRFISLHPGQIELAGLLGVEGGKERIRRAVDSLAYTNPEQYRDVMSTLAESRRYLTSDWRILSPLFSITDGYEVIDKRNVMAAITNRAPNANWVEDIIREATPALRTKYGITTTAQIALLRGQLSLMRPFISLYKTHDQARVEQMDVINHAMRQVFLAPGIANSVLTREATQPNAPTESKMAYDNLMRMRQGIDSTFSDAAEFERRARAHPQFIRRNQPRGRERIARDMLEAEARNQMNAMQRMGTAGTGWDELFRLLSTLFGTTYRSSDVSALAGRVGAIP